MDPSLFNAPRNTRSPVRQFPDQCFPNVRAVQLPPGRQVGPIVGLGEPSVNPVRSGTSDRPNVVISP
jgi:hypothetical protein